MDKHFYHSSFRERLIEHLFIGELLKFSWQQDDCSLEISKPEVDSKGYDLIAELNQVIRHIQLKSTFTGSKTSVQKIHQALGSKPSGCVIWIYFDKNTLELGPFLFFGSNGGGPIQPLEEFPVAKHNKADSKGVKALRPNIHVIRKGQFTRFDSIREIYHCLFRGEN